MGMQLSRLGLFNPKLLNYDRLENVNTKNILLIKTSTWINHKENIILIISHVPTNEETINTIQIVPYPDHNGYQLDPILLPKSKVFDSKEIETKNGCLTNIIKQISPICNYIPIQATQLIKYIYRTQYYCNLEFKRNNT